MSYIENVLEELQRVANITFRRGSSDDLERIIEKLETLSEDAQMHLLERQKEDE